MKLEINQIIDMPKITKLDSRSFDELLEHKNPFDKRDSAFDLTDVELITPTAMVQLAAASHALSRVNRTPTILLRNPNVRSYLLRSRFFETVENVAIINPDIEENVYRYRNFQGASPMLIEVTKIKDGSELPAILDRIVWTLRYRLKYKKRDAFDITIAVAEICQNTFDHNSSTFGFLAMQVYGKEREKFLEIGVSDFGDGLAKTLSRNPKNVKNMGDFESIQLATQLGVSGIDDFTRGTGLHHLLEISYKHKGAVQIRSGSAKIRFRMDLRQGYRFNVPFMPGVHIGLNLSMKEA